ncbi:MAG: hypothetical protein HC779_00760 [Phyllobacteriaceae bacterium]|nr:hypothetical protein [Phyllobacteriaceae bacterium]
MGNEPTSRFSLLLLSVPMLAIAGLVVVPLALILHTSLTPAGGEAGWTFANYQRFTTSIFMRQVVFSVALAAVVAVLTLVLAVPLASILVRLRRSWQSVWLIYILAQLSLSEVLIAFAWQILLSGTSGFAKFLVWAGLVETASASVPSLGAVVIALTYMSIPFAVLVLFPVMSRLDPSIGEAARTFGATPLRAFVSRECHELCVSGPVHAGFRYGHALKRSPNMIANWFLAANHSLTFLPPFSKLRMAR